MVESLSFETLQLHAGQQVEESQRARANPLYFSSSFVFENSAHGASLFAGEVAGNIYSRIGNPTVAVFEQRMAALEGGIASVGASSGQSAQFMAISAICSSGDNIVTTNALYGGSFNQFKHFFKRFNIHFKFVIGDDPKDFEAAIDEKTKGLYCESIGNPRCNIPDLPALAAIAHKHKIPLIVDNTFGAGGFLVQPIAHGADIVVHSATKWISGSGTAIGGVVIDSGKFDWIGSGKFPSFTEPHAGFHGLKFAEQFGESVFAVKVRLDVLRDLGSCLSPFNAWILCLGLETLSLRMERLCSNALALAEYLEAHEDVAWVSYPGLKSHEYHSQALKLLRPGHFGGVLSFGLKGDPKLGAVVVDGFKLISNVANVGDSKSLAIHPASTTHSQMSAQEQLEGSIRSDLIRVSVGTEGIKDILADFEQSIKAAVKN